MKKILLALTLVTGLGWTGEAKPQVTRLQVTLQAARQYVQLGAWDDVITEYGKVLAAPEATEAVRVEALLGRGKARLQKKDYAGALADAREAQRLTRDEAQLREAAGLAKAADLVSGTIGRAKQLLLDAAREADAEGAKRLREAAERVEEPRKVEAAPKDTIRDLYGRWAVKVRDFESVWEFYDDGTVTSQRGSPKGAWKVEQIVRVSWDGVAWDSFRLPLTSPVVGDSWAGGVLRANKISKGR